MCGRYACSLAQDDLSCAASYKDPETGLFIKVPCMFSEKYEPSCNIPPTAKGPIIINPTCEYKPVMVLGRFGVIPHWKALDEPVDNRYESHVCRLDNITNTTMHKHCWVSGRRCVVPCTAYFEWQQSSAKGHPKQPFCFFHKKNDALALIKTFGNFSEKSGWDGVQLLYLAGFYNVHIDQNQESHYSFSIITTETNEEWSCVHHRMPAILQTERDIRDWLHSSKVDKDDALKLLKKPISNVNAHPVNRATINNTRKNKGTDCLEPATNSGTSLSKWLTKTDVVKTPVDSLDNSKATSVKRKSTLLDQWVTVSSKKRRHSEQKKEDT